MWNNKNEVNQKQKKKTFLYNVLSNAYVLFTFLKISYVLL